jgi:hypothetical protein
MFPGEIVFKIMLPDDIINGAKYDKMKSDRRKQMRHFPGSALFRFGWRIKIRNGGYQ